ncbi:unnamed protein product [Arctogadus glacialis]
MSTAEQVLRGGDAAVHSNTLADDPVALDPSLDAPQKEQPASHSRCDPSVMESSSCGPVTGDLLPPAAQPEKYGESNSVSTTEKLGLQLRWVLEDRLREALPGVCLSRDGLMKDPPRAPCRPAP